MQGDHAEPRGWVRLPALLLVLAMTIAILACGITDPLEASWQRLDEALSHADGIEQLAEGEQLDQYRDAVQRGRRMRELQDVTAEQVDAMTREIEEARELAEDVEVIYGWNKPLPSYDDLVADADRYRDKKFLLGRVVSRVEDARE